MTSEEKIKGLLMVKQKLEMALEAVEQQILEARAEVEDETFRSRLSRIIRGLVEEFGTIQFLYKASDIVDRYVDKIHPDWQNEDDLNLKTLIMGRLVADGVMAIPSGNPFPAPEPVPVPSPEPAPAPEPTPAPPPVDDTEAKRVRKDANDAVLAMDGDNEIALASKAHDWQKTAIVVSSEPRALGAPQWWLNANKHIAVDSWWHYIQPIVGILPGENDKTDWSDLKVVVSELSLGMLIADEWIMRTNLNLSFHPRTVNNRTTTVDPPHVEMLGLDNAIVFPNKVFDVMVHGELQTIPVPSQLESVAVSAVVNLVGNNAGAAQVGAIATGMFHLDTNNGAAFAIGNSRALKLGPAPRRITFVTLTDKGRPDPGGGIKVSRFIAKPPVWPAI